MWTTRLQPEHADELLALAARAAAADGVQPLNEAAHLALRGSSAAHLLARDGDALVGYLQWEPGYRTAQVVVDPGQRRRGVGRGLIGALVTALAAESSAVPPTSAPDEGRPGSTDGKALAAGEAEARPDWGVWAFGDLPAARGFAEALGLAPVRGLLVMERSLQGVTGPEAPAGLHLRGFRPADEADFLAVNAAAFASHPEQGALDPEGFAERTAEPWFDPSGLILGFDEDGLAGFHWTKLADGVGEVYVIGVAPRAQGRGYGRVLLQAGLAHLAGAGADRVLLYVDMAEPVAVRMYESAGFRVVSRDVLYAPAESRSHDHG